MRRGSETEPARIAPRGPRRLLRDSRVESVYRLRGDGGSRMTEANDWRGQTGDSWAAHWRRTDRSFGHLTEHLLERSRAMAFHSVLDIGCGAGELSLALARSRPHVQVIGIDIAPQLIAAARERAANRPNVAFELADAAAWRPAAGAPEFLVSRHGVMFFDDPAGAFGHLANLAAPGARLLFSCFRAPDENPFFSEVGRLLPAETAPGDPHAPGPFAFADRGRVLDILGSAGWGEVACEPYDFAMIAGAGPDPVADAVEYFTVIGPAARAIRSMEPADRATMLDRVREVAERHHRDGLVALRAAAWIVTARRP